MVRFGAVHDSRTMPWLQDQWVLTPGLLLAPKRAHRGYRAMWERAARLLGHILLVVTARSKEMQLQSRNWISSE